MFLVPTDTPGVKIVRNVGLVRRADERGLPRAHPLRRRAGAGGRAARRRGPGVRDRADPPRRRSHPPRDAHHRPGAEGARHDVRARAQPRDAGQPARRQAVRAGLHRRLVRPARSSSGCSCSTRRGRSTSTTTTSRVRKDIATAKVVMPTVLHDIAWRAMQVHGALGTTNEMPFFGMIHGAAVMGLADGPTEVHKVTVARQVLRDYRAERRPLADGVDPEEDRRRAARSSPSTSSTKWGTCDRHRPTRARGWTTQGLAGKGEPLEHRFISGGTPERDLRDPPRRRCTA